MLSSSGNSLFAEMQSKAVYNDVSPQPRKAGSLCTGASPVSIGGRSAVVEEKRSTNSRGNRGRFPMGRGPGFRNDGMRGRGNFSGGRGYNRGGDFGGNRSDYGNRAPGRGGSSNRGGDAYPRPDSNGGRMARGVAVNGTAKNMAPRVPATA